MLEQGTRGSKNGLWGEKREIVSFWGFVSFLVLMVFYVYHCKLGNLDPSFGAGSGRLSGCNTE